MNAYLDRSFSLSQNCKYIYAFYLTLVYTQCELVIYYLHRCINP